MLPRQLASSGEKQINPSLKTTKKHSKRAGRMSMGNGIQKMKDGIQNAEVSAESEEDRRRV